MRVRVRVRTRVCVQVRVLARIHSQPWRFANILVQGFDFIRVQSFDFVRVLVRPSLTNVRLFYL